MTCPERGTAVIHRLTGLAGQLSGDPQVERLLGTAALLVGAFDLAVRLSAASVSGLRAQGGLGLLARALGAQAWSAGRLADLSVAIPAAEGAGRLARETTQPFLYAMVRASEAEIAALRGAYDRADVFASEAEQASLAAGVGHGAGCAWPCRAQLLLVHGRPQTWYAWRLLTPALARAFQVIAVDQPALGLSDKPESERWASQARV